MLISDALGHYTKTVSPSLSVNIVFFTSGADIKFLRFLTIVIFGGWGASEKTILTVSVKSKLLLVLEDLSTN